jgi:dTDP-4-amino-4,6-dideoxygalactose transaminase
MCHGLTGYGDGMIVRRGFAKPPSFHDERLRAAAPGYFAEVITHGFGALNYPFGDPNARKEAADYTKVFCPNAAEVEEKCFFVPVHPTYEERHVRMMAEAILKVLSAYAK